MTGNYRLWLDVFFFSWGWAGFFASADSRLFSHGPPGGDKPAFDAEIGLLIGGSAECLL